MKGRQRVWVGVNCTAFEMGQEWYIWMWWIGVRGDPEVGYVCGSSGSVCWHAGRLGCVCRKGCDGCCKVLASSTGHQVLMLYSKGCRVCVVGNMHENMWMVKNTVRKSLGCPKCYLCFEYAY